jgi:hypothetical protein
MQNLFHFLAREFWKALPPTLYFLALFHIALLIRYLDEESFGVTPGRSASATVSALVLSKVHLLLGERRFTNLFSDKPLILPTLWRTLIYTLMGSLALFLEEVIPQTFHLGSPELALDQYVADIVWPRFWANHLFMLASVLLFSAATELIRTIGPARVFRWFFIQPDDAPARD